MSKALSFLISTRWAMDREALTNMMEIVERHEQTILLHEPAEARRLLAEQMEAVAARMGKPLENTGGHVELRGDTAVLNIEGPLFRYANLFTACSGATSVEMLGRTFSAAMDSPKVESILLNVNSPGGEADGIGEIAAMIYNARGKKPIHAYVGGMAASGGYWIAAAADRVIAHETAFTGSIGCVMTVTDTKERLTKEGIRRYEIVSSQSPKKRLDPGTEAGLGEFQKMVDAMGDVFVKRMAEYRGVGVDHVLQKFGQGFVVPAADALGAGMIDGLGSYEAVLTEMTTKSAGVFQIAAAGATVAQIEGRVQMAEATETVDVSRERREAVKAERDRIQAILGCDEANGREALARHFALKTEMDVAAAREALAASPKAAAASSGTGFDEQMRRTANPEVGIGTGADDDVASEVAAVLQYVPANQRRRPS